MPLPWPQSRGEIDRIQSERRKVAVARAQQAAFHRDRLTGVDADHADDPEVWARIPILTKDELREIAPERFFDDFCTAPRSEIAELWRSGGSTGVPLFYPRTFEDMKYGRLSFERTFVATGVEAGATAHVSFPLGIHPVGHLYARAAQQLGIGVNWCGAGASTPSQLQVDLINRLKPSVWLGMSSYALHLANLAEAEGIDLATGPVNTVMGSAEPLSQAKRDKIADTWGARVHDNFGMTEAGMMGSEGAARDGFHIWTDLYFVEVVDLASGEPVASGQPGGLVVTPLWTNNATPFLRWSSGDVVSYHEHGDSDGPLSVFPLIRHAHRTVGFFKIRGVNVNHQEFEDFMFRMAEVADFKAELVTENDLERLSLSIEVVRGADPAVVRNSVAAATKRTFEVTPNVTVLARGTLAREFETSVKAPRFVDRRV